MNYLKTLILICLYQTCFASPTGEMIISGDVSIQRNGNQLQVIQNSDRAIINWQDFSINENELANFIQPSSSSAVLNRVVSCNISNIFGSIVANGKVYLINQNGIVI
ncbi:MAG: filamentous hemagglutinin N-terminal domain-containing protein [Chlamydiae bacterium]|nr:filamentous hemagglutinin N-terminal domain-containing protein [Chlamydiota bacterium]